MVMPEWQVCLYPDIKKPCFKQGFLVICLHWFISCEMNQARGLHVANVIVHA
jgi:hypothetical protein